MPTNRKCELRLRRSRRLQQHLMQEPHGLFQNIDMMNLAGFCRNCCRAWYREAG